MLAMLPVRISWRRSVNAATFASRGIVDESNRRSSMSLIQVEMAVRDRGQAVAISVVNAAAAGHSGKLPCRLVTAACQRLGGDALVFQKLAQKGFGFRQCLLAQRTHWRRQPVAFATPLAPELRRAARDGLQAADDLLF